MDLHKIWRLFGGFGHKNQVCPYNRRFIWDISIQSGTNHRFLGTNAIKSGTFHSNLGHRNPFKSTFIEVFSLFVPTKFVKYIKRKLTLYISLLKKRGKGSIKSRKNSCLNLGQIKRVSLFFSVTFCDIQTVSFFQYYTKCVELISIKWYNETTRSVQGERM